ncbi:nickel-binding protein [Microbacterium sp.]|uniref:nickel-binding protein n=1 Tax=Microbacterium sp. TaxID=51671 RepID=UPI0035662373
MTTYVSVHQAPSLAPEEVASYVPEIKQNTYAEFQQVFINLELGYIVTVYEADDEEAVRKEFDRIGWPVDTVTEVHFSVDAAGLDAVPNA